MASRVFSILGCGWLGLPLAKLLISHGFPVKGSTASENKVSLLKENQIIPFCIQCSPEVQGKDINNFFDADTLIITIPYKRNFSDPHVYYQQIKSIAQKAQEGGVEFIIFTGSTSVYPSDMGDAREENDIQPENERAEVLLTIEQFLLNHKAFASTILRLAGLYGTQRQIGSFLANRKELPGGNRPVNLVHQDDCLGVLMEVIRQDSRGEIYNVVSDKHPSRKDLYAVASKKLGFSPPTFLDDEVPFKKIVNNNKIKSKLGYSLKHPDPLVL